jgi:hypothetical protein
MQTFLLSVHSPNPLPAALKARVVKDPDTLSFQEAMSSVNKAQWMAASQLEISALESKDTWKEVAMSDAKTKIIPVYSTRQE